MDNYLMIMSSIETAQSEICKRLDRITKLLAKILEKIDEADNGK